LRAPGKLKRFVSSDSTDLSLTLGINPYHGIMCVYAFMCLCVFFQRKLHTRRALSMFFVSISLFIADESNAVHAIQFSHLCMQGNLCTITLDYSGWSKCKRRRFQKVSNDLLRLTSAQKFRSAFYKRAYT